MSSDRKTVVVTPRTGVDLDILSSSKGPLHIPCGNIGPLIARSVKDGGGKAYISLSDLKIATDTQSGVEAIFDHFELTDKNTLKPLIHHLIGQYYK
ncbi:hypothetical protein [Gynuella sp.]|uniref:hypothetical protein n=1 Tax=Gynuella sp. TaxID=2969146 RepID=UPI003D0EC2D3